jgi:hypothetical protein
MERMSMSRALVRTEFEEMDTDPVYSNGLLYETCTQNPSLVPCPAVLPRAHEDVPTEREQVDELIARGSGAACLRPAQDGWVTAEWCAGALLRELEERRAPVLCRHAALGFDAVADLAVRHPRLPIVMYQLSYRTQRLLVSLLKAFANVHVAVGSPWSVHLGLELVSPERALRSRQRTVAWRSPPLPRAGRRGEAEPENGSLRVLWIWQGIRPAVARSPKSCET